MRFFKKNIDRWLVNTLLIGMSFVVTQQAMAGELIFEDDASSQRQTQGNASQVGIGRTSANTATNIAKQSADQTAWTIFATDGRLATTFERWAGVAGMKLLWDAQQHVMLSTSDSYVGTLEQALERVLSSPAIRQSEYPLEACIYPNNPQILRVTRLGDQKDCK